MERAEARQEHAHAIFAMGHYLDAAEEDRACADVLGRHGETGALIGALHGLAEANRCAGRFIQAKRAIRQVERIASDGPELHGSQAAMNAAVLRLTLRRHLFQIRSRASPAILALPRPFPHAVAMSCPHVLTGPRLTSASYFGSISRFCTRISTQDHQYRMRRTSARKEPIATGGGTSFTFRVAQHPLATCARPCEWFAGVPGRR